MRFKRALTILITLLILFADSGQTIYAHTCLKSKHTHLSINQPKHCCSEKVQNETCQIKKAACCEVSSKYLKVNFINDNHALENALTLPALFPVAAVFSGYQKSLNLFTPFPFKQAAPVTMAAGAFTHTFRI